MKKLFILPLLALLVFFSSCKKEYITQVTPSKTIYQDIKITDWVYDATDKTYYTKNIDLTNDINTVEYADGAISVAVDFNGATHNYEALPQVYNGYSYTYFYYNGILKLGVGDAYNQSIPGLPFSGTITAKITLIPATYVP
ncbi:hypothetical protein SAMN05421788_11030 [Filimonas lacunae]|uniref:DUF4183 domain-containing protein n=1 Tax=Filimonas lacunae TaxID=477680 RepID=A0A173M9V4_9BACT|nr:hypothetical protein [Filimonas lacunae]BAV04299.1 hypothetical protein FLA_0285 [Filimonas lacunae]SIT30953.1 hypothetical protein SAMN05421788_11030 [Filimonas lacunae]